MKATSARAVAQRLVAWFRVYVAALLFALIQPAWAVRCVTEGGSASLTEPVGNVASYPVDAPDGYLIWISAPRTTSGYCYKDVDKFNAKNEEPISFHANPEHADPATSGFEVGIRYNGVDYFGAGSEPGGEVPTGYVIPPCPYGQFDAGQCTKIPISITYQVLIRKRGVWAGARADTYAVFQLDGARGLNAVNSSFRYRLSGLNNLKPTPCLIEASVTPPPGIVQFGSVRTSGGAFLPTVPRKPFSLALQKKCDIAVRVDGYFETSQVVSNGLLIPSADSNFGIGIEDRNGNAIPFNQAFRLAEFPATVSRQDVAFNAVLKALGPPKTGPFNGVATIRLFLY